MEYKYKSINEQNTVILAQNIETEKFNNMIICLNGELGSGKTLFTKAFAKALGIKEEVTSPTFNIIKEYNCNNLSLIHMDLYRLESDDNEIGIEDYFNNDSICLIEWAEIAKNKLPKERLEIEFKIIDETKRLIILNPHGKKYEELCESVI